jgi:hypothetical protein
MYKVFVMENYGKKESTYCKYTALSRLLVFLLQ